jgi:hypothetical protein
MLQVGNSHNDVIFSEFQLTLRIMPELLLSLLVWICFILVTDTSSFFWYILIKKTLNQEIFTSVRPVCLLESNFFLKSKFWKSEFQKSELFSDIW